MKTLTIASQMTVFNIIPSGIGQQRAIHQTNLEKTIVDAIKNDLNDIVTQGLTNIETTNDIVYPLQQLLAGIKKVREHSLIRAVLSQYLRFLILVIQNRISQLQHLNLALIQTILQTISRDIGTVPILNEEIPLPDKEFLPKNYDDTSKDWAKMIWINPGRRTHESKEELEFFRIRQDQKRIASVRLHLLARDKNSKYEEEAFSYTDVDFYAIGDLQADHLQPSESVLFRQLEMIEAMNLDPLFRDNMVRICSNRGYFIETEENHLYGSKKFFMEYHNCVGNLWLISAAANTGQGKGNQDPILWLKVHPRFGETFFNKIGGEDSINKSHILYTTHTEQLLADAAREFVHTQYQGELIASLYIKYTVKNPLLQHIAEVKISGDKKESVRNMARLTMIGELVGLSSDTKKQVVTDKRPKGPEIAQEMSLENGSDAKSNSSDSSSIRSSDAEISEVNLERMSNVLKEKAIPKWENWNFELNEAVRDYKEQSKLERKHKLNM